MFSLTENVMGVVNEILSNADALGCKVHKLGCGATVVDMGLECKGSWKAALLFTRATLGDLAIVQLGDFKLNDDYSFAAVEVFVEQPMIACMASEIAGWSLGTGEYATIASGPARSQAVAESDHYIHMTPYRDQSDKAVVCLQDIRLPNDALAMEVAQACHVKPENTYILISDSTCMTASMQVSARIIEQSCHKMMRNGFSAEQIVMCRGRAPIAPIVKDELKTMGRINDALIYGSEAEFWVDAKDEDIETVIHKMVGVTSSPNYGELFVDVFDKAGRNFFNVEVDVHSIAKCQFHNVNTGRSFHAGAINYELLERSFLG